MPFVEAKKGFIPSIFYQLLIACCRHCEAEGRGNLISCHSERSLWGEGGHRVSM